MKYMRSRRASGGDLLALALSRLQAIAPDMQRAALSATVAEPEKFRQWLAPWGDIDAVELVEGEQGAPAEVEILLPDEERVPWGGHAATWAVPQLYEEIRRNTTTLIFTNTRFLAEYIYQNLWDVNEDKLPIGIHHGSLSKEARRKVEGAMARGELRALVATASLDLGVDWGDIDLVVQMGAPKGSSRLLQRIGRANHRLDQPSRALLVPGNRFEFLEATAARDAVDEGQRDGEDFRPGGLDVLAQHVMGCACAAPFDERELLAEIRSSLAYAWVDDAVWQRVLSFVENGGYALKAYDKFKRITRDKQGVWRLSHPEQAQRHRINAGIIIDSEMLEVRISAGRGRGGRSLGKVEERFAASLSPGDTFAFAGMSLEVVKLQDMGSAGEGGQGKRDDPELWRPALAADHPSGGARPDHAGRPGGLGAFSRRRPRMAGDAGLAQPDARTRTIAGRELPPRETVLQRLLHLRGMEREPEPGHADHPADGGPRTVARRICRQ